MPSADQLADVVDCELAWLVNEHGYARGADTRLRSRVRIWWRSERTVIECYVSPIRDPEFHVWLEPPDGKRCTLNQCLEAHGLPQVDLSLPYSPSLDVITEKAQVAAGALRALEPFEIRGDWSVG